MRRASGDLILVHSSDLHLGSDSYGGSQQGLDALAPLRQVLEAARSVAADLVLLAGDIFDHNRQSPAFLEHVTQLVAEANLPVVILPGNHDPLTPDSVYRRSRLASLPSVRVLGLGTGEIVEFPRFDLEVWGRPHLDYADMSPLQDPLPRRARWHVAMAHGHFVEERPSDGRFLGSWLIAREEIEATGADYVALGHWNRAARVGGRVPAYYCGSPDLAGSVNVVRLADNGTVEVVRHPLAATPARDGWSDPH